MGSRAEEPPNSPGSSSSRGSIIAPKREGKVGGYKSVLSDGSIAEMDAIWRSDVEPVTGFGSYTDLEAAASESQA